MVNNVIEQQPLSQHQQTRSVFWLYFCRKNMLKWWATLLRISIPSFRDPNTSLRRINVHFNFKHGKQVMLTRITWW